MLNGAKRAYLSDLKAEDSEERFKDKTLSERRIPRSPRKTITSKSSRHAKGQAPTRWKTTEEARKRRRTRSIRLFFPQPGRKWRESRPDFSATRSLCRIHKRYHLSSCTYNTYNSPSSTLFLFELKRPGWIQKGRYSKAGRGEGANSGLDLRLVAVRRPPTNRIYLPVHALGLNRLNKASSSPPSFSLYNAGIRLREIHFSPYVYMACTWEKFGILRVERLNLRIGGEVGGARSVLETL